MLRSFDSVLNPSVSNRDVRRSSFTTSMRLVFQTRLRGTKEGASMKKAAVLMAELNVFIFHLAFLLFF